MRRDRREGTTRAQDRLVSPEGPDRRSPATYVTRRDVAWLVALLTLLDTLVKLVIVAKVGP